MEKETKSTIIFFVINLIFSIILTNLGLFVYKENKVMSIITILFALIVLYFSFYIYQIRKNENKINELLDKSELNEKLLNTIKDIVILNKVKKIK